MTTDEKEWTCIAATYRKKIPNHEVFIETYNGDSWKVSVKSHLVDGAYKVLAEIGGLKDFSVARSVAIDLIKLSNTINLKDTHE